MVKLTTRDYIDKVMLKHNGLYDYSKVNYNGSHNKIEVICKKHGNFNIYANDHLKGHGCPECGKELVRKKLSLGLNLFIKKAKDIHNDSYDYSSIKEYKNSFTTVEIICKTHGSFYQTPDNHLHRRSGCPKCGINKSRNKSHTTEWFISRSLKIHNNKEYDYSKVDYKNSHNKVKIVCKKHGEFEQLPYVHLNGHGCLLCGNVIKNEKIRKKDNTEDLIKKFNEVHKRRYNYTNLKYHTARKKIEVICPIHGSFFQSPFNHLNGHGCPKCGINKTSEKRSTRFEIFVNEANKVHRSYYTYSSKGYKKISGKVNIICPKHGLFIQTGALHLNGSGCPKCNFSKGEIKIEKWLNKNNIGYIHNKKFDDCKNPRTNYSLKFDFYLIDKNILIEFDGIQHYQPIMGNKSFEDLRFRDGIKDSYAANKNIKLIRIPYYNLKNIDLILENNLT